MHSLMDDIIEAVMTIRDAGQKEYAHDESDVFANFNRVAALLEEDRKKVLMTYMLKHVDGIAAYVKGYKSQREDVTGRITDCMVYLMLLWGMIEEEDGSVFRKEIDTSMHNVQANFGTSDRRVSMDRRRSISNGVQPNDDLQKMRQARNGLKESEKMGRA